MKKFAPLLYLILFLLLLSLASLMLPSKVHVERSIEINSPPCTVFTLLNGFLSFNRFSPFFDVDPQASYTHSGPVYGPGATMSWRSENSKLILPYKS